MRKALIIAGCVIAVLVIAVVVALSLIDVNQYRPQIQAAIEKQLHRQVSLGTMSLRIIPLAIRVSDVSIAEDPAFRTGVPFASAKQVSVSVSLLPLLRKQVSVNAFVLRQPVIELVRNSAGKWNFSTLGAGGEKSAGGGSGGGGSFSIGELRVEDGQIGVRDLGKRRSSYDHINITLTGFAPGKPFNLTMSAALPGAGADALRLEAAGGPLDAERMPLSGKLEIRQARLAGLRQFLNMGSVKTDGVLSGEITFALKNSVLAAHPSFAIDKLRVDGDLRHDLDSGVLSTPGLQIGVARLSGQMNTRASTVDATLRTTDASIADLLATAAAFGMAPLSGSGRLTLDVRVKGPLDRPADLDYAGSGSIRDAALSTAALTQPLQIRTANLKLSGKTAALEGLICSLAGSTLRGGMALRNFAATPQAEFQFDVDRLDLVQLQKALATSSSNSSSSRSSGGSGSGPGDFSAKGRISVGTIAYNELVLRQVRADCSLARGVLALDPLTAEVFGGTETGGITLDMRSQPATVTLKTKLESVDANKLLSATTSVKQVLFGLLAAGGDASMKLASGDAATRSLNGNLSIKLIKGRLGGISLLNELSTLGKFAGFAQQAQPFTDIVQMAGDIRIRDGIASSDNLALQINGGTVSTAGTVNLVDQSVNMRLTAVLDRATSQRAGGSQIGGLLTTALMNRSGEVVVPAILTGTLAKPRFAPDPARIAEMKLKNVLPGAGGTAASGVLDLLTGKKKSDSAPAGRGLFDALDSLRKKPAEPAKK